ncbi:hypothetical protein NECID01_1905 [Nematocida sp. AWRm77]|nr:hypothetical protein NECID01_1905 [Nematocida sp. AWRm77]
MGKMLCWHGIKWGVVLFVQIASARIESAQKEESILCTSPKANIESIPLLQTQSPIEESRKDVFGRGSSLNPRAVVTLKNITALTPLLVKNMKSISLKTNVEVHIPDIHQLLRPKKNALAGQNRIEYINISKKGTKKASTNDANRADASKKACLVWKEKHTARRAASSVMRCVLLRGICLLANSVLVPAETDKALLHSTCGIPLSKIGCAHKEEQSELSTPPENTPTGKQYAQPSQECVASGLYVLYSDPHMHVNASIQNRTVQSVAVRCVHETPHRKQHSKAYCRGPYNRTMAESFVYISHSSFQVRTQEKKLIRVTPRSIEIQVPSAKLIVDRKDLSTALVTSSKYVQGAGMMLAKTLALKKAWKLPTTQNLFLVKHPRLRCQVYKQAAYLYNMPRRARKEMFDPPARASPLRRVSIVGQFQNSGIGLVSKKFLHELRADQRFLVEGKSFFSRTAVTPEDFDRLLMHTYRLETKGLQKNREKKKQKFKHSAVEIRNSFPPNLSSSNSGHKLAIHFPWEFSLVPQAWAGPIRHRKINVLSPSLFTKEAHVRSGVPSKKITVVPHGVDCISQQLMWQAEKTQPKYKIRALYRASPKRTRFLMVNGALERKGIAIAIQAYTRAFKRTDKVVLRIHCSYGDPGVFQTIQNLVNRNKARKGPLIVYSTKSKSEKEIRALFASAHYNLSPYRGEGFGLSILEGMAMGAVPIVTECKPATEICSSSSALFIPCCFTKCTLPPVKVISNKPTMFDKPLKGFPYWATPNEDKLVDILKEAHAMQITRSKKYKDLQRSGKKVASHSEWNCQLKKLSSFILRL